MINIEWDESTGLLITCEDLEFDTATNIVFPIKQGYMLMITPEEKMIYSDRVLNFKKGLCLDVLENILDKRK